MNQNNHKTVGYRRLPYCQRSGPLGYQCIRETRQICFSMFINVRGLCPHMLCNGLIGRSCKLLHMTIICLVGDHNIFMNYISDWIYQAVDHKGNIWWWSTQAISDDGAHSPYLMMGHTGHIWWCGAQAISCDVVHRPYLVMGNTGNIWWWSTQAICCDGAHRQYLVMGHTGNILWWSTLFLLLPTLLSICLETKVMWLRYNKWKVLDHQTMKEVR